MCELVSQAFMMYKGYLNTSLIAIYLFIASIASAEGVYQKDILYDAKSGYRWLRWLGPAEVPDSQFGSYSGGKPYNYYDENEGATFPEDFSYKATAIPEVTESSPSLLTVFNREFYKKILVAAQLTTAESKPFSGIGIIVIGLFSVSGFILLIFTCLKFNKLWKQRRNSRQETDVESGSEPSRKTVSFSSSDPERYEPEFDPDLERGQRRSGEGRRSTPTLQREIGALDLRE